jgi:hypothetical protein
MIRLRWLQQRYPTLKSYCSYLEKHRKYWSSWNRTWELNFGIQSSQGLESLHASFKGPLDGVSIPANHVPEHTKDCWDKRADKQVKCYSINSSTYEEKPVMHENVKQLSAIAANLFGGMKRVSKIHKYINRPGSGIEYQ